MNEGHRRVDVPTGRTDADTSTLTLSAAPSVREEVEQAAPRKLGVADECVALFAAVRLTLRAAAEDGHASVCPGRMEHLNGESRRYRAVLALRLKFEQGTGGILRLHSRSVVLQRAPGFAAD